MEKKHILFVDDEPNILSGIKRMLRSMRKDFDFHFAEGGIEALATLEQTAIDIVVSDMRMPGMDGVELLTQIKQRYPHIIRIMLSGQADDDSVMKTVSIVHQFLAKPCEAERFKNVLIRAGALLEQVNSERLKTVIAGIVSLPSLPSIFAKLQGVLNNPEVTADQVADIIEQDMAMTAKLLHLVNSSFFGFFQKVDSPARAVKLLGLETIKSLVLGVQIFAEMKVDEQLISLDFLWRHSMAVAHCSKSIALDVIDDEELINHCFIAGMLHDIGRLLLISKLSKDYKPIVEKAKSENISLIAEEAKTLQSTHADIGAYLIGLWGFGGDIIEAIAFHDDIHRYPANAFTAALAVHVANVCYYERYPEECIGPPPLLSETSLKRLGYDNKQDHWRQLCADVLERMENGE